MSINDPLYDQAVEITKARRTVSISAIQRALMIGYNRAARMIERMEEDGIISHLDSSGRRRVLQKQP